MAHDVMISYSTKNLDIVKKICSLLEGKGIKCWYARRDIPPGESFPAQCVKAIESCKIMILIFSSDSNQSSHLVRELTIAADMKKIVIPFKIEDVLPNEDMKYFLITCQWLDATANQEEGISDLIIAVENALPIDTRQSRQIKKPEAIIPSKPNEISIEKGILKPAEPKVSAETISTLETKTEVLKWPEIGHNFLKQVKKNVDLSQLPFKPTWVSAEEDIEEAEEPEVDWSVNAKYYFAVWLPNKRKEKVDLEWGYYSKNQKRDPIFRKTCDAISENQDLLNKDNKVSINDYIYSFNDDPGDLGFDTKIRIDFPKLTDPGFVKHISDQIVTLSQKIWPMIKLNI